MNTSLPIKLTAAARLALGTVCLCAGAIAGAATDPLSTQVVRYADLDISHLEGARVLYRRIQAAARQVCHFDLVSDRHLAGKDQACFKHAVDEAVQQVDSVALSQIHGSAAPRFASR